MLGKLNFRLTGLFTGSIDVKMDRSFLEEKPSFRMLGLALSSKLDGGSYIISIAKTASKKIGASVCSMRLLCFSISLPYDHAWNILVMSELVLVAAIWNC